MDHSTDFASFYAGTERQVFGHVYARTGDRAESEEAVAEAYARAWQRWSEVRTCRSPEAWVRSVASRVAVSSWRKSVNRQRAHRIVATGRHVDGPNPDHVALVDALGEISAAQCRAIVLHYLVGLSVAEIAEREGSPAGTVLARLSRGRQAIAKRLADA
jgi:RNA polymerase sigma-70 factor (ECF subfamily)